MSLDYATEQRRLKLAVRLSQYAVNDTLELTRREHRRQARFETVVTVLGLVIALVIWFLVIPH